VGLSCPEEKPVREEPGSAEEDYHEVLLVNPKASAGTIASTACWRSTITPTTGIRATSSCSAPSCPPTKS
jgi:hypothetical protein